jgi:hypothetical protein
MPLTITPDKASARFGELLAGDLAKTYQHFQTPEGDWRPEFGPGAGGHNLVLTGYRLFPRMKPAPAPRPPFRRKPGCCSPEPQGQQVAEPGPQPLAPLMRPLPMGDVGLD